MNTRTLTESQQDQNQIPIMNFIRNWDVIIIKSNRLILFEGIPGSGKTTTAQLLQQFMLNIGIKASVYIEGSNHPIDLPFHAYLHKNEYEKLLKTYPQQEDWLNNHSIIEDEYVLIPYKTPKLEPFHIELVNFLQSQEFCFSDKPIVSFTEFRNVFKRRFEQFAELAMNNNDVIIFESVLFQHQIHDLNRLYPDIDDIDIIDYIKELADIIRPLNPILFYLSQESVKVSLMHTAHIRSKPYWSSEETINYYIYRKSLEIEIMKDLPIKSITIDNTQRDWDNVFNRIITSVSVNS